MALQDHWPLELHFRIINDFSRSKRFKELHLGLIFPDRSDITLSRVNFVKSIPLVPQDQLKLWRLNFFIAWLWKMKFLKISIKNKSFIMHVQVSSHSYLGRANRWSHNKNHHYKVTHNRECNFYLLHKYFDVRELYLWGMRKFWFDHWHRWTQIIHQKWFQTKSFFY